MQQPSAQGIASLYMGNPQPLQQQIQKEQQAKPGLPPDLQKMLALQIVTNEKNAAAAQTAMQQLKQMSGPTGQMPTVMQTLEQQAQQKLQGQQQPPMGGMVPQGQAPQGQGIDQLPAEFQMAGGGLVAFDDGGDVPYETPYDRMNRKNRGEPTEEERKKRAEFEALLAQIPTGGPTVEGGERVEGSELGRNVKNTLMALPGASAARALSGSAGAIRGVAAGLAALGDRKEPEAQAPAAARPAVSNQSAAETARLQRQTSLPQAAPANDLAALARQKQQAAAPRPAAPVAPPVQATPPADSEALGLLKQQMRVNPADREAGEIAKYKAAVPSPDTSQYDRLVAELESRKQALNPKQGYEGLMEALSDISRAGQDPRTRGRGSFASGAAGALIGADRAKENQLQQFELSKQAIEVAQKKLDVVRAYAEKTYGVGKAAFDQVYKDRHEAAKEVVKDEAAAARLAKEETLKIMEMRNAKEIAAGHDATTLAATKLGQENRSERLALDAIKAQIAAIDKDLAPLLKFQSRDNDAKAAPLKAKKAALMKQLNDTILGAPDEQSSAEPMPILTAAQKAALAKYPGK